ncbi:MAG: hypothetical protein NVSMB9_32470 [Isosphaeraceae bacterium]
MRRLGASAGASVLLVLGLTASLWPLAPSAALAGDGPRASVDFNRDIRPLLSETCFQCHGPDKAKRKGKFRLDTKEGAFVGSGSGPVIVPG